MFSRTIPCLTRSETNKLLKTSLNNLIKFRSNSIQTPNARNPKKGLRNVILYSTAVTSGSLLVYYEFALNAQERRRLRVTLESISRAFRALKIGVQVITDYKWSLWNIDDKSDEYSQIIKECHLRTANLLVKTCIANGGMYVKMGQGLSTMNHILPKEFYTTLRQLQNEALRSEGTDIDNLFLEEFNKLPSAIFKDFDYKPIAAASLAQVHTAKNKETNEKIAVKLQYIDLRDRFAGDFLTCKYLLKLVGVFFPDFNFSWVLDELKDTLNKELDFENEAENSKRCYNELKHLGFIHVPKVYDELTTKRVLTMEFIDGINIGNLDEIKKQGLNLKEIDENLIKLFGEQIFNSGFVHADPHHGNIMVRKKKGSKNTSEIVLLDHGLYCFIGAADRKNLCNLWKAIILKDEKNMKYFAGKLNVDEKYYLVFAVFLTMRELHRPIHNSFIFAQDWLLMSQEEKEMAKKEGKIKLPSKSEFRKMSRDDFKQWKAEVQPLIDEIHDSFLKVLREFPKSLLLVCRFSDMLTMEPNFMKHIANKKQLRFKDKLSDEDILSMRETVRTNFDKIQIVLKQVSSYMLLVFRNLNTVRSIVHDHGNLIDRHTIMARIAVLGAYKDQMKLNWKQRLYAYFDLTVFELVLAYDRVYRWAASKFIQVLIRFGQISPEILNEIKKTEQDMQSMDHRIQ